MVTVSYRFIGPYFIPGFLVFLNLLPDCPLDLQSISESLWGSSCFPHHTCNSCRYVLILNDHDARSFNRECCRGLPKRSPPTPIFSSRAHFSDIRTHTRMRTHACTHTHGAMVSVEADPRPAPRNLIGLRISFSCCHDWFKNGHVIRFWPMRHEGKFGGGILSEKRFFLLRKSH